MCYILAHYIYIYYNLYTNTYLHSPWAAVRPWGNPGFCSSPPRVSGCPARPKGTGVSSPQWVFPHLPAAWKVPSESKNPFLVGCAVPAAKHVKIRQRHVGLEIKICGTWSETGEGWDHFSQRSSVCTAKTSAPNGPFLQSEGKNPPFLSIALENILFAFCWILKFLFPIFSKFHVCWQNTSCKILNLALPKPVSPTAVRSVSLTWLD